MAEGEREVALKHYVIYVDSIEGRKRIEQFDIRAQAQERADALRRTAFARDVRVTEAM
jgi:hypothetical protein